MTESFHKFAERADNHEAPNDSLQRIEKQHEITQRVLFDLLRKNGMNGIVEAIERDAGGSHNSSVETVPSL